MSTSEVESSDNDEKSKKCKDLKIKPLKELQDMPKETLLEYIETLHAITRKNYKKIKKYKEQINKLLKQMEELHSKAIEDKSDGKGACSYAEEEEKEKLNLEKKHIENDEQSASDAFSFVDEMRQAAQHAQSLNNFVYEPTSGLYYDQKSGYYYNAEYGLYYDGNNGCYYSFNQEKNCYEFHSQVGVQPNKTKDEDDDNPADDDVLFDEFGVVTDRDKMKRLKEEKQLQKEEKEKRYKKTKSKQKDETKDKEHKHKSKKRKKSKHKKKFEGDSSNEDADKRKSRTKTNKADIEDGELSSSSSSSSESESNLDSQSEDEKRKAPIFKSGGRFQDIAKKYPPSLRVVIQDTNLEELKIGNLSLITYKGGSLGREGNHDVIIPDVNVSKYHLKFMYDHKKAVYKCIDMGSRNGTVLNGERMSSSKNESKALDLVHGSVIQIAQTKLLCHIHKGNSTCGLCEPGLLIEKEREIQTVATTTTHKEQLKKLQKKYGLENEKFVDSGQTPKAVNYNDRAATRRLKIGSSTDKEKTQSSSVNTEISCENKGFKLLSKLGWSKGETLGKSQAGVGLLEPINVESNSGTKGLGCDDATAVLRLTASEKRKIELMKKTQERYKKSDIFSFSDDESN